MRRLKELMVGYHDKECITKCFMTGFSLGVQHHHNIDLQADVRGVAAAHLKIKINDEVNKGRIVGPFRKPPIVGMKVSPAHAIPKPNSNKLRLILRIILACIIT